MSKAQQDKQTAEERSAKAKDAAYRRARNKIPVKVLNRIINETIDIAKDNFERHYGVGKYAPQVEGQAEKTIRTYPTWDEVIKPLSEAMVLANRGEQMTSKIEVREDWHQAYYHMEMAVERIRKAITV